MIYYIYEVIGHKNGATIDWEARYTYNFNKYLIEPIVIETMEGPDNEEMWQIVGDREWELADLNGYKRGDHYLVIRRKGNHNNKTTQNSRIKKGGQSFSPGNHKEGAIKGGLATKGIPKRKVECPKCGGSISASNLTVHMRRKNPCT